jgi:hippurate hydrolase
VELEISIGYPSVVNDHALTQHARSLAEEMIGTEMVEETELSMGAEDFGYYSQKIPGCFYRLGTGNKAMGIVSGVHTPTFNIDESAIQTGMAMMAYLGVKG